MAIPRIEWPPPADWRDVLLRSWKESSDDNVSFLAAGVAFYAFLAFVPLLASAVLIYGLVAEPETVAEHIRALFQILPSDAASLIGDQLKSLTATPKSSKGWSLVIALAIAIYGASKGSGAIVTALNIAYEVKETRGFFINSLLSLGMTIGALVILVIAAIAISMMGWMEALVPGISNLAHLVLQAVFWAVAVAVVAVGLALVYRYAPNRPDAPWAWVTPGSAAATLLWLAASIGFGLYVSHFGNYNATYGSLGGVIVFLTWLYLTAYIVLMGGEMNSELERQQTGEPGATGSLAADQPAAASRPETTPSPARVLGPFEPQRKAAREPPPQRLAAMALLGAGLGFLWGRHRGRASVRPSDEHRHEDRR
jgi:membrane protein